MSFLLAQVMHFYAVSYIDLLKLPLSVFWEMSKNIGRIQSDEDLRLYRLVCSAFSKDGKDYIESVMKERGDIVIVDELTSFDSKALGGLKRLIGG